MIYLGKGTSDGANYVLDGTRGGDNVLNAYLQNSQQRARCVAGRRGTRTDFYLQRLRLPRESDVPPRGRKDYANERHARDLPGRSRGGRDDLKFDEVVR